MRKWKIIVPLIIVMLGAGMGYVWREYHRKPADTKNLVASEKKEAMALLREFTIDETVANGLYNDKVVSVKGTVIKIENKGDTWNIMLGDGSSAKGVICEFQGNHKDELEELNPGQQISVKGICTGMLLDVVLVRCVVD